jgi:hypothetical protein
MSPDEQSLVQRRPFGGYGVWTGLGQACSGSKSEDIGGVSLPVVRPVLGVKPKITLIGPLHSAILVELSDDALATLRESLSNVVRDADTDAGDVLVGPAPPVGTPRSCGAPSPGDHLHPRLRESGS